MAMGACGVKLEDAIADFRKARAEAVRLEEERVRILRELRATEDAINGARITFHVARDVLNRAIECEDDGGSE